MIHQIKSVAPGAKKYIDIAKVTNNMVIDVGKISFYMVFRPNIFVSKNPLINLVCPCPALLLYGVDCPICRLVWPNQSTNHHDHFDPAKSNRQNLQENKLSKNEGVRSTRQKNSMHGKN